MAGAGVILRCGRKIPPPEKPELNQVFRIAARRKAARGLYYKRKIRALAPVSDPTAHWFQKYAGPAAKSILEFCRTHGIVDALKSTVSMAEKCFQPSIIGLEEDIDPETDDRKIVIALSVHNKSRQDVLAAYRDFRRRINQDSASVKERIHMRLSYNS